MRSPRHVVAAVLLAAGSSAVLPLGATEAPAAPDDLQHAALIVDTGTEVKKVCARFRGRSVRGTDILDAAKVDPVYRTFPGTGAAVCALCGTGCPADGSCLTCGGATYWSYWRAGPADAGFATSQVGAGSTEVAAGTVEGWRWGDGKTPPPYQPVDVVCDDPGATTVTLDATLAGAPGGTDDDRRGSGDGSGGLPAAARFAGVAAILAGVWVVLGRSRRRAAHGDESPPSDPDV